MSQTYLQILEELAIEIVEIQEKFKKVNYLALDEKDREEFRKIEGYVDLYSQQIMVFATDQGIAYAKKNQAIVKDFIEDVKFLINRINTCMNLVYS